MAPHRLVLAHPSQGVPRVSTPMASPSGVQSVDEHNYGGSFQAIGLLSGLSATRRRALQRNRPGQRHEDQGR
jgi:hypothetical protein